MSGPNTWERFCDLHAPLYNENMFVQNTAAEVDFLLAELGVPRGGAVLGVG